MLADTLLVQRDDVLDFQSRTEPALLDLVDDDRITQSTARHGYYFAEVYCRLLQDDTLMLLLLLNLLLTEVVLLTCQGSVFVGSIAKDSASDGADYRTDDGSRSGFVVIVTDHSASNGAGQPAVCGASLLSGLSE